MLKSGHLLVLILIQFSKILLIRKKKTGRRKKYQQRREQNYVLKIYLNFPKKENKSYLRNEGAGRMARIPQCQGAQTVPKEREYRKFLKLSSLK